MSGQGATVSHPNLFWRRQTLMADATLVYTPT